MNIFSLKIFSSAGISRRNHLAPLLWQIAFWQNMLNGPSRVQFGTSPNPLVFVKCVWILFVKKRGPASPSLDINKHITSNVFILIVNRLIESSMKLFITCRHV